MLETRRFRLTVVAAAVGSLALIATLVLTANPGRIGPKLAAPGSHYDVSAADSANGPISVGNGISVGGAIKHDTSKPLRDLPVVPVRALPANEPKGESENAPEPGTPNGADTVVQSVPAAPSIPSPTLNFEGIDFPGVSCNCAPPDTNGEVGATQYVQIVNEGYQVWNKSTGASVFGPVGITTIWGGFSGVCQSNGDGDPVVLYDQFANRWLVSQFAGASVPTDECVAISTTSDATGAYYRYDFHLGSNFFDYPHLAVWPDGYYMSMNVFNSSGTSFLGAQAFVFDRSRMLGGLSATFQAASNLGSTSDPILPADVDGSTLPPANAPETFVRYPRLGTYQTYHYHVDWTTPANSTFTTFASPAAASFSMPCGGGACVAQPSTTSLLDTLGDRLMFRLAYRNFGDHESVVGNYTVASGGVTGIRWFELRNVTSGPETVFQQSTYQPDSTYRWMGSAAMDHNGDIAVGFSASSSSVYPSLRYAGRLSTDTLNTLGQGEAVLFAGLGSQSGTSSRWGDYSDMTIDPVDDCTFWFTSEYYPAGVTQFNWRTRIGSFSLPGCGGSGPTTGSISGHVTDSSTTLAISGATVSISGGPSTTTDGSGAYSFSSLSPATYSLTASATGHVMSGPASVPVTAGNNTVQDFALAPTSTATSTAFIFPTAANPVTSGAGDNNGFQTAPAGWFSGFDGNVASDPSSGTASSQSCTSTARDKELFSGFSMGSLGSSILGIRVQLRGRASSTGGSPKFCVQLSSNGGSTWSAGKVTAALKTTLTTYTLGTTADLWGTSWTPSSFGSSFRVRITDLANNTSRTFYLDGVSVSVTYQ